MNNKEKISKQIEKIKNELTELKREIKIDEFSHSSYQKFTKVKEEVLGLKVKFEILSDFDFPSEFGFKEYKFSKFEVKE